MMELLPASEERYRLSRLAQLISLFNGATLLVNGFEAQRICLDASFARCVPLLREGSFTESALGNALDDMQRGQNLLTLLLTKRFVVSLNEDELAGAAVRFDAHMRDDQPSPARVSWNYWTPRLLSSNALASIPLKPLRMLLIGGCILQFAEDSIVATGVKFGFAVETAYMWPSTVSAALTRIKEFQPDLTIVQLSVQSILQPVTENIVLMNQAERIDRARTVGSLITTFVISLRTLLDKELLLVHNVAPPWTSPFGRLDSKVTANMRDIIYDINHRIDRLAKDSDRTAIVDEERLANRFGALELFDDSLFPFSHHGGATDPRINEPNQLSLLSEVLADEYFSLYEIHESRNRIKCIVVDLDNTLWPGIAAEEGFGWIDLDSTQRWTYLGLHEALRILAQRGMLIATASRGSSDLVLPLWREAAARFRHLLAPSEFVAHKIAWQSKSKSIGELIKILGLQPANLLFVDDDVAERFEVRRAIPMIQIFDGAIADLRRFLLGSARLEAPVLTDTAGTRTTSLLAQQGYDWEKFEVDSAAFIRDLNVKIRITAARREDERRFLELFSRTNQFNTLGETLTARELRDYLSGTGGQAIAMWVADRFADHGLVGGALVVGQLIKAVAVSCRVLNLDAGVAFLRAIVSLRPGAAWNLKFRRTPRNDPAADAIKSAGFTQSSDELYERTGTFGTLDDLPQQFTIDPLAVSVHGY